MSCEHPSGRVARANQQEKDGVLVCESCGAEQSEVEGIWRLICTRCGNLADELFGLFVPHLCSACYTKQREEEISDDRVCGFCRQPWIDCCC